MKINLEFAELHTPLFLAGSNLGLKLQIKAREVKLEYDRDEKELLVYFNKKVAIIPSSNVASMTPVDAAVFSVSEAPKAEAPAKPQGKIKAQVSTPTSHVFAGEKQ